MWIEFITNTNCNWNCSYCAFSKIKNAEMTIESINKHHYIFNIIKKLKSVEEITICIEGGEVGLISDNAVFLELFKKFEEKVIINTNGEFFKQNREVLYPYIEKFFFHAAPDSMWKKVIPKISLPIPVVYGIVDETQEALDDIIERNPHITFEYTAIEKSVFDKTLYLATAKEREDCQTLNPFVSIDLAREVLCMCSAKGCHVTIPLTEENLIKVLTQTNIFGHNDMCSTCYRTCTATPAEVVIKRKERFKNVLGI